MHLVTKISIIALLKFVTPNNEYCHVTTSPKFQISYVVDATASYKPFINCAREVAKKVNKHVMETYKDSQFALTKFADYDPVKGKPELVPRGLWTSKPPNVTYNYDNVSVSPCPHEKTDCYKKVENFSPNYDNVDKAFQNIMEYDDISSGGNAESSLTAILFTAKDMTLDWKNKTLDYRKVLILCTDEDTTITLGNNKGRKKAEGDGTDTCDGNLVPDFKKTGGKLNEDGFVLVVLASQGNFRPDIEKIWEEHVQDLNVEGLVVNSDNKADAKIQNFLDFHFSCKEADPPAYNILGL